MNKYIITAALISLSLGSFAQNVNKLIDQNEVGRIIKTLSADDMQGRATFSPGIDKAATFIEGEFKKAGLKFMDGATGYRQTFTKTRNVPVKTQANINSAGVPSANVFAVAGGSFTWTNNADVQIINETADKNFTADFRTYLSSGKKTLVLVDSSFAVLFNRIRDRYTKPSAVAKADPNQQVVFVLGKFSNVKSFEVSYEGSVQESPLFNVVGVIPGKTKPNEYVVFSGHYDHLGILKAMQGDSIANGADDDASGTTAVITLAKYYKKLNNNARTLIFVAFTAEEVGGFGAQHFTTTVSADKVIAMFNIEMIGKASKFGENSAFITGYERSDFGKILQKNLEGTDFKFYPDPYPTQNLFYRSDNATLARLGVPAHTISTDQIDTDKLYHTVGDEFKSLDVANITATIKAIALSSRSIVSGQDTPTRVAKLER